MRKMADRPPFPTEIDGVDPLSSDVFRAFMRNLNLHRHLMMRLLAAKDAPHGQAICLRVLVENDGASQADIADRLHLARPTVTTMLQRMQKAGLIERRVDETDQRVTRVYMTAEGRAIEHDLRDVFVEYVTTTIDPMTEEERRDLARLLGVLADNTQRALDDADAPAQEQTSVPQTRRKGR
jgi:DNA-binding MarR family transcriptional regulator